MYMWKEISNFAVENHCGMTIKESVDALERFAPLSLQEDYDNAGLQVGLTDADASGALLCLDITPAVVAEAVSRGCNLIVSHHPLIFRGLKQVCDQNMVARCVAEAVRKGICIYSAHTNLDNARGGVNYEIAQRLGATVEDWLRPLPGGEGGSGVVAVLPEDEEPLAFLKRVKEVFGIACLATNEGPDRPIRRIGICGGAGDFLIDDAAGKRCDCFLTGEMHYHQYFGYEENLWIGVMGHYESERFTIQLLHRILAEACPGLPLYETEVVTNPIRWV